MMDPRRQPPSSSPDASQPASPEWRAGLPTLGVPGATLREIQPGDAEVLWHQLGSADVSRFIAPPPSLEAFVRYILRSQLERQAGRYACFVVVPTGTGDAAGVFQLRPLEAGFTTAEWGFALGSAHWGSGLFVPCARAVLEFAFGVVGVHRLEARAAVNNPRCNAALRKLGAVQEGVLRRSFRHHGQVQDENLWSLLADEWAHASRARASRVH